MLGSKSLPITLDCVDMVACSWSSYVRKAKNKELRKRKISLSKQCGVKSTHGSLRSIGVPMRSANVRMPKMKRERVVNSDKTII